MRLLAHAPALAAALMTLGLGGLPLPQSDARDSTGRPIPKVWDDEVMAKLEVPLAVPGASPKHVPAEFYYRIPVRPIYRTYPVYHPSKEPPGYLDMLRAKEPEVLWDDEGEVLPSERTRTGFERENSSSTPQFSSATAIWLPIPLRLCSSGKWTGTCTRERPSRAKACCLYRSVRAREREDRAGSALLRHVPHANHGGWRSRQRGAGQLSVRSRVRMGRTGGRPCRRDARPRTGALRCALADPGSPGAPWRAIQRGDRRGPRRNPCWCARHVTGRARRVLLQVPDLIGVRDRRYLDRTGLQRHDGIADLMRYAALEPGRRRPGELRRLHSRWTGVQDAARTGQVPTGTAMSSCTRWRCTSTRSGRRRTRTNAAR